jgi:capsular exopolysaccharide synthesis family protein
MDYARIARSADVARQLYTSLQASLNAARLDRDAANGNVDIAYPASVPDKPLRPDMKRDLFFGAAVGLLLSVITVFLLEQADRRVHSPEEMRRLITGPVVGTIPQLSRSEVHSLASGGDAPRASEAYSMIWANLSLVTRRQVPEGGAAADHSQTMLITSSLPGEGKSFTAAQLARNIARAGKRVLLVDADLRRPMQNRLFNMNEPVGLANVLSGDLTLDDALVASGTENLTLLHAGSSKRNPTELISSEAMTALLEALRSEADIVIIDAPACAVVADALFIAPHIDTIVHVIGAGQVDSALVRDTTAALAAAAPKIMTYLMNRAPGGTPPHTSITGPIDPGMRIRQSKPSPPRRPSPSPP